MADPRVHRMPPVGVRLTTDVERRVDGFRARVRWTDPTTNKRIGRVSHVRTTEEAEEFFDQMRTATETGNNTTATLTEYATSIGDRWKRGLDLTSTAELYEAGLRLRVLPTLGHIKVARLTAGMIDRTIDGWETEHSASTIKNSIAPLVRVLDEAVRDDIITINPAKAAWSSNRPKAVAPATFPSSTHSNRCSVASPTTRNPRTRSCVALEVECSPQPPSETPPNGTLSSPLSGCRRSPATDFATPARPGSPTPGCPCTCSSRSSGTNRSRPPRPTYTPTTGTSPTPQNRPTSSSLRHPDEGK